MTVVDVHTHFLPRFFVAEAGSRGVFGAREEEGVIVHPQGFRYPVAPEFVDVDAKPEEMDRLGIDMSVLSAAPTLFFHDAPATEAVEFARRSNDALAGFVGSSRSSSAASTTRTRCARSRG